MADEPYDPSKHGPIVLQTPNVGQPPAAPEPYDPASHGPIVPAPVHRDLADVPAEAASNLLPSIGNKISSVYTAATEHPVDLVKSIVASNPFSLMGMMKFNKDFVDHVKDKYGSWDKAKETAATDPATVALDIAQFIPGVSAGAKAAGIADKAAGITSKIEDVASTVSPVNVLGGAANKFAGVGEGTLQEAYRSGKLGDQIAKDFREGMRDPAAGAQTALDNAKRGIQTMKSAMFDKFAELKDIWSKDGTPLNFDAVDKAEQSVLRSIRDTSGSSPRYKVSDTDRAKIQGLQDVVDQWRNDPAGHSIESLDALKQRLRNEVNYKTDGPEVIRAATTLSNAAKDAILSQVPDSSVYRKAMKGYFDAADHVDSIEKALALGKRADADTSIRRLQSVMRNNANTLYGSRRAAAEALEKSGDTSVIPSLAGQALSSSGPRGLHGLLSGGAGLLALERFMHGDLLGAGSAAALGVAQSPRVLGEVFHGAGRLNSIPMAEPGIAAARTMQRVLPQQPQEMPARRRGGFFSGYSR